MSKTAGVKVAWLDGLVALDLMVHEFKLQLAHAFSQLQTLTCCTCLNEGIIILEVL